MSSESRYSFIIPHDSRRRTFTRFTAHGRVAKGGFKILGIHKTRRFCALIEAVAAWIVLMF